jgi:hypothetical protein
MLRLRIPLVAFKLRLGLYREAEEIYKISTRMHGDNVAYSH